MSGREWLVRGGTPLSGAVEVAGFKHAVPPLVALALIGRGRAVVRNVPDIEDLRVLLEILEGMGGAAEHERPGRVLRLDCRALEERPVPPSLCGRIHGSMYLVPALLARHGSIEIGPFGGCPIGDVARGGERPIAHVIEIMRRFGCELGLDERGILRGRNEGLRAARIDLSDFAEEDVSTGRLTGPLYSGATKTAILAAVGARGVSRILRPYRKPDVTELLRLLAGLGVLEDEGDVLTIEGRPDGLPDFEHELVGDVLEAMTFIACSVHLRAPIRLKGLADVAGIGPELAHLEAMGVRLARCGSELEVRPPPCFEGREVTVSSHGVYSDSQPFFALMLTGASTPSVIHETVWTNRFDYADPLRALGARLERRGRTLHIDPGRPRRAGQTIEARDLRAAATLALAALAIEGPTRLRGVDHLPRGYDDLLGKLRGLGATIEA